MGILNGTPLGGRTDVQHVGHTMMAILQVLAFLSYIAFSATILAIVDDDELLPALLLPAAGVIVGVLWIVRHRLPQGRGRAACSILVLLLLLIPSVIGQLGFNVPFLLVAQALLVIDVGLWAGLLGNAIVAATGMIVLASHGELSTALVNGLLVFILTTVGTALGLLLVRYEALVADQQSMISERDAALVRAERQAVLEKELVLAEERARAAHELHDGLGHRLTHIGMSLEFASRVRDSDPSAAWAEIAVAQRTTREAVGEMRTWVRALSPAIGEGERGVAGLDAVAASFRGTGVHVDVEDRLGERALEQIEDVVIHRAVQEGLTNALRHSHARHVTITVACVEGGIEMRMVNRIAPELLAAIPASAVGERGGPAAGFGIGGLADRARELGGWVRAGRDNAEFVLHLFLPNQPPATDGAANGASGAKKRGAEDA
ncbi:sensor histidine kinase [Schaalia sp. Marseille-Q2122]|uniref:sensor histidine kinase n=1 Tax=Schaalia sp. Marseille-Q2122 TaxID=2736604 RepID=UPI0020CA5180|nr:histidine kinase [Schaalia sp. Marseille-Q2122]